MESGATYTSFGLPNALVTFARGRRAERWAATYVFDVGGGRGLGPLPEGRGPLRGARALLAAARR